VFAPGNSLATQEFMFQHFLMGDKFETYGVFMQEILLPSKQQYLNEEDVQFALLKPGEVALVSLYCYLNSFI
jgi:hypothetical protein